MSIRQIGPTPILTYHTLSCHCGAVEMELHLPDGLVSPRRCDCSFCRRRSAIMGTTSEPAIRILRGEQKLTLYQFNTCVARHFFCSVCGIYTHHQRRSNPQEFGFNVACLEGVNPRDLGELEWMDGVNHPADRQSAPTKE